MLDQFGKAREVNPGEETRSTVEEEQAANQGEVTEKNGGRDEGREVGTETSGYWTQTMASSGTATTTQLFGYGLRKFKRLRRRTFLGSVLSATSEDAFSMIGIAGEIFTGLDEPSSVSEAPKISDCERFEESIAEELDRLWEKGTFKKGLPQGTTPIKLRFLFNIKLAADEIIERYKSTLVASRYTQR